MNDDARSAGIPSGIPAGIPTSILDGPPAGIDKNWDSTIPKTGRESIPKFGIHIKKEEDFVEGSGITPSSSSKSGPGADLDDNDAAIDFV